MSNDVFKLPKLDVLSGILSFHDFITTPAAFLTPFRSPADHHNEHSLSRLPCTPTASLYRCSSPLTLRAFLGCLHILSTTLVSPEKLSTEKSGRNRSNASKSQGSNASHTRSLFFHHAGLSMALFLRSTRLSHSSYCLSPALVSFLVSWVILAPFPQ